jgi:hypothetical protein
MKIVKFSDFSILEAKVQKDEVKKAILDMFKEKPSITPSSKNWPVQKGLYSLSSITKHLSKYSSTSVSNTLDDLKSDKEVEVIYVKNIEYKSQYPYYYAGLSKGEANKIKSKYESDDIDHHKDDKKPIAKAKTKEVKVKRKPASSKSPIQRKERK